MSLEETSPQATDSSSLDGGTQPVATSSESTSQPSRRRRLALAFIAYIAAIIVVGLLAYFQGRSFQESQYVEEVSQSLEEQYLLGVEDLEAGRYELAQQRFEAIIRVDPAYPGVEENITEAYLYLDVPTLTPKPAATATPDPSPPEELIAQAKAALVEGDWSTVITKLLTLRSKDPDYEAVTADGLMYIALRNRGMERISEGSMEEGLYDLSLAERFGPLDRDAMFKWTLAQTYIAANSYIGLNWLRAAELFGPLCVSGATLDSCRKFAESAWNYGDLLWNADDPCGAEEYYDSALEAWPDPTLEPTAEEAEDECDDSKRPPPPPRATDTPVEATPTPTPESGDGGNGNN